MKYFIGIEEARSKLNLPPIDGELLSVYRDTAIDITLEILNRTEREIIDTYDGVPDDINDAIAILIKMQVDNGDIITLPVRYRIPYEFDEKVKNYINLENKPLTSEQIKQREDEERLQKEIEAKGRILGNDYLKNYLRIEIDNDELLEWAAMKAQNFVLKYIRRSFGGLKMEYGKTPAPIIHAMMIMTEAFYLKKGYNVNLSKAFKILLKPYRRKQ